MLRSCPSPEEIQKFYIKEKFAKFCLTLTDRKITPGSFLNLFTQSYPKLSFKIAFVSFQDMPELANMF